MFYDEFVKLCKIKGVSRQKACIDCDVSRTAWNKWKNGATPNGATMQKIADYFGVSVDFLLTGEEKAPTPEGERKVNDDDIKFALFGGSEEITDAMYNEVKNFAAYVKNREKGSK